MRSSILHFLEAITGIGLGVAVALTLQIAIRPPLHAQTVMGRADHACRLADKSKPPYLHGDVVSVGSTAYLCDGYSGNWRKLPEGAARRIRGSGETRPPIL